MPHPCAHCGGMVSDGRPVCPDCGADADLTYVDDSHDPTLDLEEEGFAYEEYLAREGLAPRRKGGRKGCLLAVLGILLVFLLT